ncbi:response regulator [Roseobacteraceae bacterium S113]
MARRVLVVDDLEVNRLILRERLVGWGMDVVCVASAQEALALLKDKTHVAFDALISDFHMPEMDGLAFVDAIRRVPGLNAPPIVVASSSDNVDVVDGFKALNVRHFMTKPVRSRDLLLALIDCLAEDDAPRDASPPLAKTMGKPPEAMDEDAGTRARILVADDNATNRAIIAQMLDKAAFLAEFVSDGQSVLDAHARDTFDAVLMDVSMPIMDGVTAMRAIREREKIIGENTRLPIIVVTAHAMAGDRERLLAEGFDDYLSKPIRKAALNDILVKWAFDPGDCEQRSA